MNLLIACLTIWSAVGWSLAWYFSRESRKARHNTQGAIAGRRMAEYHARLLNALLRQAVESNRALRERIHDGDDDSSEAWKRQ